jgi:hypothetical protein
VRWDSRLVRLFNDRWEQLAVHAKAEPGRFRTDAHHIPKEKVSAVERGTDALLRQVAAIGPQTRQWAEAMTQARGVEGGRVLVGLKALAATTRRRWKRPAARRWRTERTGCGRSASSSRGTRPPKGSSTSWKNTP